MTPEERKAKQAKLADAKAANQARLDELNNIASDKRLENELRLHELAQENNLTIGVDIDAVWTPGGEMVAVRKPEFVAYDEFTETIGEAKPSERPAIGDKLLKACLVGTTMQKVDELCDECGDIKRAAINKAIHMHDVARATLEGKS